MITKPLLNPHQDDQLAGLAIKKHTQLLNGLNADLLRLIISNQVYRAQAQISLLGQLPIRQAGIMALLPFKDQSLKLKFNHSILPTHYTPQRTR